MHLLHVDDYNNIAVQEEIYAAFAQGRFTAEHFERYYQNSINYEALIEAINNMKKKKQITIIEGVFLFRKALPELMDLRIFLSVDPKLASGRYKQRKKQVGDDRPVEVFEQIWLPAFERYCREEKPSQKADLAFSI